MYKFWESWLIKGRTVGRRGNKKASPLALDMSHLYGKPCKDRLEDGQGHVLPYITRIRVCSQNRLHHLAVTLLRSSLERRRSRAPLTDTRKSWMADSMTSDFLVRCSSS